jgi:hypothetical protein
VNQVCPDLGDLIGETPLSVECLNLIVLRRVTKLFQPLSTHFFISQPSDWRVQVGQKMLFLYAKNPQQRAFNCDFVAIFDVKNQARQSARLEIEIAYRG